MKCVYVIFPNQLFYDVKHINEKHEIYLIEEFLFFKQYNFHKQKIAFHRATMKSYEDYLVSLNRTVNYIDSSNILSDIRNFETEIKRKKINTIRIIDPNDEWLLRRIKKVSKKIKLIIDESKLFINTKNELSSFFREDKITFFQTTFYKQQRKKLNILIDEEEKPAGGKWTYDSENRKKYPKNKIPPKIKDYEKCLYWDEAKEYVSSNFSDNFGELSLVKKYPINRTESLEFFNQFLSERFNEFGVYEDAILKESSTLNHSILSPIMNVGILEPLEVVSKALSYSKNNDIPINSTEGFIRQIIGWREFIRGMYICKGNYSRTKNFWKFSRKIPKTFYDGTTGIEPIDNTIKTIIETGYCHHIERLMVLGNFMLLCEFDPDEVYLWFMEVFIDSYDWVMVPNVYGMTLFADGGTFATKPYIGGSNYIKKMSNYGNGQWCEIWDSLFWRFVLKHKDFFLKNPRTNMLTFSLNRMSQDKRDSYVKTAENFLKNL